MKFSIITCNYNSLEGLRDAVKQVQNQAAEEFQIEHVIIDGGSTDGSVDALRVWDKKEGIKDNGYELKWISEPDQGLYDALNKGMRMATGDVIGILHTDDVWEEGVLQYVANTFDIGDGDRREASVECGREPESGRFEDKEAKLRGVNDKYEHRTSNADYRTLKVSDLSIDAVYGNLLYVHAKDVQKIRRVWTSGPYDQKKWFNGWMPPHPALFVRRDFAMRVGEYRLDLGSAADYEWMLRAALVHDARMKWIPKTLVRMRVGGQSNVHVQNRLKAHAADIKAWEINGLKPRFWTLKLKVIRKIPQWLQRRHL